MCIQKVAAKNRYPYFKVVFFLLIGYTILRIKLAKSVQQHKENEDTNNDILKKIKKARKTLPSNLKKKCYNENISKYNVTIDGEIYPKTLPLLFETSIDFECLKEQNKDETKVILSWNNHFGIGMGGCPVTNCHFTRDRRFLEYADYVVFHGPDFVSGDAEKLPPVNQVNRPDYQRWVLSVHESPMNTPGFNKILANYEGYFNLTASYREDSDFDNIYEPSSELKWEKNNDFDLTKDYSSDKSGLVTALISNCNDYSGRTEYLQELNNYASVDIYGTCGKKCPKLDKDGEPIGNCRDFLIKEYLFYFAGENSICKDYITEKFFIAIKSNIVPIVLGGGDYGKFIPKSGFINALDFPSPIRLAEYLNYLKSNKTAYNEFFKWKQHVTFRRKSHNLVCDMCIALNLESQYGIKKSIVKDLGNYWNTRDCKKVQIDRTIFFKYNNYTDLRASINIVALIQENHHVAIYVIFLIILLLAFIYIKKCKTYK